jgi:hypothetical protein
MNTCICIPTKRKTPVLTLESFSIPDDRKVLLICDPEVYQEHKEKYENDPKIMVVLGVRGMARQASECYRLAALHGYDTFLRLDDDLQPDSFIHVDGYSVGLEELINEMQDCMEHFDITLVGLQMTSNRYWLDNNDQPYGRAYSHISGGVSLVKSSLDPTVFVHPLLRHSEDTWRTCSHRQYDIDRGGKGLNGRVNFIGFNFSGCMEWSQGNKGNKSIIDSNQEDIESDKRLIEEHFSHLIEFGRLGDYDNGGKYRNYKKKYLRYKPN